MGAAKSVRRYRQQRWLPLIACLVLAAVFLTQPGKTSRRQLLGEREGLGSSLWFDRPAQLTSGRGAYNLKGRAACVAGSVGNPAPVHGWVEKVGPLPMELLDGPQTPKRHQAYFAWRDSGNISQLTQEVEIEGEAVQVARVPPLFPYCRILVNHVYRTLYLKAPKTGSTSLLTLLGTCSGVSDKSTCFEPLKVTSREEYEQMYSDYFVFTVIRNPWTRAVSSYRMLSRYMRSMCKDLVGGWNKVCLDLNRMGRLHHDHPECTIHKQQGEGFAMHHLIPQAPCLVTADRQWAVDYVVRTENLAEDMQEVLKQMNARRQPDAEPLDVDVILGQLGNVNKVHVACRGGLSTEISAVRRRQTLGHVMHLEAPESYCNDMQYFLGEHYKCFDGLRAYYADDVRLFGMPQCLND